MRITLRQYAEMARAVPRVAPLRPLVAAAVLMTVFVLAAPSAGAASTRMRVAAALVAATAAFALDDDAATTLAPVPMSRLVRRFVRFGVAAVSVGAWLGVVIAAGDALTGFGRPSGAALLEVGAVGFIAFAGASLATGRTDDGRGGIAGVFVALVCFATAYLPPRWWWPFTAEQRVARLACIALVALAVSLATSADPARRRHWFG